MHPATAASSGPDYVIVHLLQEENILLQINVSFSNNFTFMVLNDIHVEQRNSPKLDLDTDANFLFI